MSAWIRLILRSLLRPSLTVALIASVSSCSKFTDTGGTDDQSSTSSPSAWSAYDAPCGNPVSGVTLGDGWTDLCEVPDPLLVSGGWTDSAAITPSGLSLYFAYSTFDFGIFQDTSGVTQTVTGPTRTGMMGDYLKMFRADLTTAGWTVNFLSFNGDPNTHEASASPNAAEDTVVFSRLDGSGVASIYYTTKNTDGTWTTPAAFPTSPAVNTPDTSCGTDNPFIIGSFATGFTLYFESNRNDAAGTSCRADGKRRLYSVNYYTGVGYSTAAEVGGLDGGLANEDDTQISVSTDKQTVYFTRVTSTAYGIFTGTWDDPSSSFTNIRQIVTPTTSAPFTGNLVTVGEANVATTARGSLLYMVCGIGTSEVSAQHTPSSRICFAKKPAQ